MAVNDRKFAEKSTNLAPLTRTAQSFSPDTFATPDFAQGRVVLAQFKFPGSQRLSEFGKSYTKNGIPDEEAQ